MDKQLILLNNHRIKVASHILQRGGVIAYPTEAVFGLGCDPMNPDAIRKLLSLKNRSCSKGLILVAASFEQLDHYISQLSKPLYLKVMQSWPGPVNWLLPANLGAPAYLRGSNPLQAVRISDHPMVVALCRQFGGAIVSTSANLSMRAPAKNMLQTRTRMGKKIDYILPGYIGNQSHPCEIRHGLTNQIVRC